MGNVKTVSDNYIAQLIDDYIGVITENKPIMIGLPHLNVLPSSKAYTIKDESGDSPTYNITIYCTDGALIDNSRTYTINSANGTVQIQKNGAGTGWSVISLPSYSVTYNTYVTNNVYTTVTSYVTPEQYGAVGDGVHDDSAAINAAFAAAATLGQQCALGKKTYYCASSLTISSAITFLGAGQSSVLLFRNGINGLCVAANRSVVQNMRIVPTYGVSGWQASAGCTAGITVFAPSAGYSQFVFDCTVSGLSGAEPVGPFTEGQTIVSGSATFVARHVAGLRVNCNGSTFKQIVVSGIGGEGCELDSSTGNNCDQNEFYNCRFDSNLGNGIHLIGADSNVNLFAQCSLIANRLKGVFDQSALGNFYLNPHFDSNIGYAFDMYDPTLTLNSASQVEGAYMEGGQTARLAAFGMWIGGIGAQNVDTTLGGIVDASANGRNTLYTAQTLAGTTYSKRIMRQNSAIVEEFGVSSDGGRLLQQTWSNVNGAGVTGWWGWIYGGNTTPYALSTNLAAEGGGKIWMPNGFLAGGTDYNVEIKWGDNAPTSGTHKLGDIVYARAGLGGVYFWQCTSAGTPGTWQTVYRYTAATSSITLAVSTSGSDTPTSNRYGTVFGGDYTAYPFLTLAAALANLPTRRDYDVVINIGAGSFAGATISPWTGKGKLTILGATSLASLASGSNSGTAGTGTTSTSLVKPNAASNWTVNDLQGKRILITGGGGYDSSNPYRTYPIKSNTTTAASVDTITGMDSTTTFQIVSLATTLVSSGTTVRGVTCCLGAADTTGDLIVENIKINDSTVTQGVYFSNNARVTLSGCDILPSIYSGVGLYDTGLLTFERNYIAGPLAYAEIIGGSRMTSYRTVLANSRLLIQDYRDARGWVESQTSSVNSLKLISVADARFALNANSCTATPLYLDNTQFKIIDAGLTGTNNGTSYGVEVYNGSLFYATGATITGVNNVHIEDQTVSWATIALGAYEVRSSNIIWGAGSQRFASEIAGLSDVTVGGIAKLFGFFLAADNGSLIDSAFLSNVTAAAGGGQNNAVQTGYIATVVTTAASLNDSIKFRASAKGEVSLIWNASTTNIALFPPSTGTINGGSVNAAVTVTAGAMVIGISTTGVDYRIKVIT